MAAVAASGHDDYLQLPWYLLRFASSPRQLDREDPRFVDPFDAVRLGQSMMAAPRKHMSRLQSFAIGL